MGSVVAVEIDGGNVFDAVGEASDMKTGDNIPSKYGIARNDEKQPAFNIKKR